jgi:hypothetical protein
MRAPKDIEKNKIIVLEPQRIRAFNITFFYEEMAQRKVIDDQRREQEM